MMSFFVFKQDFYLAADFYSCSSMTLISKNLLSILIALYLMLNKREGRFKAIFKVPLYKTAISFGDCVHVYSK